MVLQSITAIGAIATIISMQRVQLQKPSLWMESPQQAEQQEAVRLDLLRKVPSFGFDNMVANWAFLQFVQYDGDSEAREKTGYTIAPKYFDLLTQRDPRFIDSYLFLSGSVSYQLGQPKLTLEYMQRGMDTLTPKMTPKAFVVWRMASLDQLLLVGDIPGTVRSLEMAGQFAGTTEEYKDLAPVFTQSAAFLKQNPDSRLIRLQSWATVYEQAKLVGDRKTQERAKQEIFALGGVERVDEQGNTFFTLPAKKTPQQKAP
jgi:hypothetical protein